MARRDRDGLILAGDIGGTKTRLGIFALGPTRPSPMALSTFSSRRADSLESAVDRFLASSQVPVGRACFAVAGPVVNGRAKITNLPWEIEEQTLKRHFRWSQVSVINDVAATALALPLLRGRETKALNRARARREQTKVVVAPGTGLGVAFLLFNRGAVIEMPSEGGHADFAPGSQEETALLEYLRGDFPHVSIERVLGGPGLVRIYNWLRDSGRYHESAYVARMMGRMDPAKAITRAALERGNKLSVKAIRTYVSILGSVSSNLALTGMAMGGVYLGGGIPPKILPFLEDGTFWSAFVNKGRFRGLLERIPVKVILNDRAALLGAAAHAINAAE